MLGALAAEHDRDPDLALAHCVSRSRVSGSRVSLIGLS
jgi:hypothetical protein